MAKILIIVDIQPEYERVMGFDIRNFCMWLNKSNFHNIIYLYNGYETLGMIRESDLQMWLIENGLDAELLNEVYFYDKGYAFFRYCMDEGIADDDIVSLIKFMDEKNIVDSREMNRDFWKEFIKTYKEYIDLNPESIKELLEISSDIIYIPNLMNELKKVRGELILVGGGLEECLKEVEICLMALDKKYTKNDDWTY